MVSKRSRGGFSLIEVIISVVIISVVGMALLELSSKNTKLISFLEKKREVPIALSIISYHGNADINNLEKTLYDIVEKEYTIESDRLKKYLDSKKVLYREESIDRIDFGSNSEEGQEIDLTQQIEIYKQSIKSGDLIGKVYSIRVE